MFLFPQKILQLSKWNKLQITCKNILYRSTPKLCSHKELFLSPWKKNSFESKLAFLLTIYNKVFMHSVYLSVCAHSNSRKSSSNVLKLIKVFHIWPGMDRIENGMRTTTGSSTETHKTFPTHYGLWEKMFKAYLNLFISH